MGVLDYNRPSLLLYLLFPYFYIIMTKAEFIKKATIIHGDKYDYSKVEYINTETKVCIICLKHGEFWQRPHMHIGIYKTGCPICANNKKKTTEEYIQEAKLIHGNKYDYSKVEYINNKTKICIICPEHGEFLQNPTHHLNGSHCPQCANIKRGEAFKINAKDFIEKAIQVHGNKYDYSKVEYIGSEEKVCIICPIHGEFWQTPHNHLNNHGCPGCNSSRLENEIEVLLKKENIDFKKWKTFKWLKNKQEMELDFYLPKYNIGIECQGEQHYKPVNFTGKLSEKQLNENFKKQIERDNLKKELCAKNNITLLYYSNFKYNNNIITDCNELLKFIK